MKVSSTMLINITNAARQELQSSMKDRHETHEEYLARCWVKATFRILKINNIEVDGPKDIVLEPLE